MGLQQHQIIQQKKHVLKNNAGKKCASYVKKKQDVMPQHTYRAWRYTIFLSRYSLPYLTL